MLVRRAGPAAARGELVRIASPRTNPLTVGNGLGIYRPRSQQQQTGMRE